MKNLWLCNSNATKKIYMFMITHIRFKSYIFSMDEWKNKKLHLSMQSRTWVVQPNGGEGSCVAPKVC